MDVLHSFRLDGRVAVVIGGSGVLCSRIAEAMAQVGARVVIVGRDSAKGEAALTKIREQGLDATFEACDAAERHELQQLADRVVTAYGRVDVLVNGAGVNSASPFLEISDGELQRLVAVNQLAVFRACQEFGRIFVARAQSTGVGASIITIGSMAGLTPLSRVFTYSMTKAAVHNLTVNLAREWGPMGIRCNVLVPGFFPAGQNRNILDDARSAQIMAHTPMGRFGVPEDLIGASLLLAGDAGRFITGAEIVVDGGFNAVTI